MLKKLLGLLICVSVLSFFVPADAHGDFTWFGLRRNNTEVTVSSSSGHHVEHRHHHKHKPKPKHKHKHKPKPKHKKHHHKKGPNFHKWWNEHWKW